jgi:lactocepin
MHRDPVLPFYLCNLPWVLDSDYPDGDYYVKVTVKDKSGLTLSSEPRKFTVKR